MYRIISSAFEQIPAIKLECISYKLFSLGIMSLSKGICGLEERQITIKSHKKHHVIG
jgi:hypothetical protein